MAKYFADFADVVGRHVRGADRPSASASDEPDDTFNMAVMGLRLAGRSNGVAQLHGAVSREMFNRPVARRAGRRGAHRRHHQRRARTHLGGRPHRRAAGQERRPGVGRRRRRLVDRRRPPRPCRGVGRSRQGPRRAGRRSCARAWATPCSTRRRSPSASPAASPPTSGPRCCCRNPTACARCCSSADRPVQFVFAGKAHPQDQPGKDMIRDIELFARQLDVNHRFVFVPDYDMAIARMMYHGVRRVAEQPASPARGLRHQRHEGGAERRAQLQHPRRLVGRMLRRRRTAGPSTPPTTTPISAAATHARPPACSGCSSARSCRCSTTARRRPARWAGSTR